MSNGQKESQYWNTVLPIWDVSNSVLITAEELSDEDSGLKDLPIWEFSKRLVFQHCSKKVNLQSDTIIVGNTEQCLKVTSISIFWV